MSYEMGFVSLPLCRNCRQPIYAHGPREKCLFEATHFAMMFVEFHESATWTYQHWRSDDFKPKRPQKGQAQSLKDFVAYKNRLGGRR